MEHSKFKETLDMAWNEPIQGNPQTKLVKKLKRLKESLKKLNKKYYGKNSKRFIMQDKYWKLLRFFLQGKSYSQMDERREYEYTIFVV